MATVIEEASAILEQAGDRIGPSGDALHDMWREYVALLQKAKPKAADTDRLVELCGVLRVDRMKLVLHGTVVSEIVRLQTIAKTKDEHIRAQKDIEVKREEIRKSRSSRWDEYPKPLESELKLAVDGEGVATEAERSISAIEQVFSELFGHGPPSEATTARCTHFLPCTIRNAMPRSDDDRITN